MSTISAMRPIPSAPRSSSLPTKGEMKAAPAFAASSACATEKQSVTLTRMPSSLSALQVRRPSTVSGTLTTMFGAISTSRCASRSMVSKSVATTSAETGPLTSSVICSSTAKKSPPDFAMRLGLVVMPSSIPVSASNAISRTSAVSAKNFMDRDPLKDGLKTN